MWKNDKLTNCITKQSFRQKTPELFDLIIPHFYNNRNNVVSSVLNWKPDLGIY